MRAQARLFLFYMLAVATLSCVDLTYEWLSPLEGEFGAAIDWSAVVGLRNGAFLLANHEMGPTAALNAMSHTPEFFPLPFVALAGPEGGGFFVAVWFVGILAYACHATLRPLFKRPAASCPR